MTSGEVLLQFSVAVALVVLGLSFLLTVVRVIRGPTLPDRVLALDMLVAIGIGFIAVTGIAGRATYHVDIAISLALVGFLATVAFARFVLSRRAEENAGGDGQEDRG